MRRTYVYLSLWECRWCLGVVNPLWKIQFIVPSLGVWPPNNQLPHAKITLLSLRPSGVIYNPLQRDGKSFHYTVVKLYLYLDLNTDHPRSMAYVLPLSCYLLSNFDFWIFPYIRYVFVVSRQIDCVPLLMHFYFYYNIILFSLILRKSKLWARNVWDIFTICVGTLFPFYTSFIVNHGTYKQRWS